LPNQDPLVAAEAVEALRSMARSPTVAAPAEVLQEAGAATGASALRNILLGVVFGGVLSVAVVASLEYWQNPVRSPDKLERRFGLAQLGTIPQRQKGRKLTHPLTITSNSNSAFSEAVRQAATSVEFTALPRGIKMLAVTSPSSDDGSSLIANLGVALATGWRDVILVDADLRRPSLHRYFDLDNSAGLSSFLSDPNVSIADLVQETSHQRLKVITSCPVLPNPVDPNDEIRDGGGPECPRHE
jgi:hypothetical protein